MHYSTRPNKQLVKGDILIDDNPHNLVGGEYIPILFDRPHNHDKAHGITRAQTWEEVKNTIRRCINYLEWKESLNGCNQA